MTNEPIQINDDFEQANLRIRYLLPDQKLAKIIEWLYVNDNGYKNVREWREALINMLKETI